MSGDLVMRIICLIAFVFCFLLAIGLFSNGNSGQGGIHE